MIVQTRNHLGLLLVSAAVVQLCFDSGSLATTKYGVPCTCPICKGRVDGYSYASTNTFGGQDRDFLKRAAGDQPILFLPSTCSECFYSGYLRDFGSDVNIPGSVRDQILRERLLKPMAQVQKGVRSDEIPVHVRYDLIAQTYRLRGETDEVIAQQFLNASWAVRLESELPTAILGEELVKKVREWATSQWNREEAAKVKNPVLYQIQKGREYRKLADSSEGETRLIAALAAIHSLRLYGENAEAQSILPMLKTLLPSGQYSEFEQSLNESIARERHFQAKAVTLFEKIVGTQENAAKKASLTYLCGELYRRLGDRARAASYYTQCIEIEGHSAWLEEWVKQQRALLPE